MRRKQTFIPLLFLVYSFLIRMCGVSFKEELEKKLFQIINEDQKGRYFVHMRNIDLRSDRKFVYLIYLFIYLFIRYGLMLLQIK